MSFLQFVAGFQLTELTLLAQYIYGKANSDPHVSFFLLHAYIIGSYKPSISNEETLTPEQTHALSNEVSFMAELEQHASVFDSVYQHMCENMSELPSIVSKGDVSCPWQHDAHACNDITCSGGPTLMLTGTHCGNSIDETTHLPDIHPDLLDLSGDWEIAFKDVVASPYASDDEVEAQILCPIAFLTLQDGSRNLLDSKIQSHHP